jgi:hypothetical protein
MIRILSCLISCILAGSYFASPFLLGFGGLDAAYYWTIGATVLAVVGLHKLNDAFAKWTAQSRRKQLSQTMEKPRTVTKNLKTLVMTSALMLFMSLLPATSQEWVFGIGADGIFDGSDQKNPAFVVEYHAKPFHSAKRFAANFAIAGQVNDDEDTFIGAGLAATYRLSSKWFVEGSFMPGYYNQGTNGTDLGGDLQFRSLIGVGYKVSKTGSISLAIDHKSNAGIGDINPGIEAIFLRYRRGF